MGGTVALWGAVSGADATSARKSMRLSELVLCFKQEKRGGGGEGGGGSKGICLQEACLSIKLNQMQGTLQVRAAARTCKFGDEPKAGLGRLARSPRETAACEQGKRRRKRRS